MKKTWVKPHRKGGKYVKGHFKSVKSSNLFSFSYDSDLQDLRIKFKKKTKDGANAYLYADVPEKVVERLESASSKGKFFHKHIRPKFNYSKIKPNSK